METFRLIKSPVAFATKLSQAIIWQAFVQHFKLLQHPSVKVQQWAIENAYKMPGAARDDDRRQLTTQPEIKQLAAAIAAELPSETQTRLTRSPFQFVEAEVRVIEEPIADG